jgi:hypothetical protein
MQPMKLFYLVPQQKLTVLLVILLSGILFLASIHPVAAEPLIVESLTVQPSIVEPSIVEPSIVEPSIVEPSIVAKTAEIIQNHLESNLDHIPRAEQKHYALRMFRITGDSKYIDPISADMLTTAWSLQPDLQNIDQPDYARRRAAAKLKRYHPDSPRSRARYQLLIHANEGTMDFSRYLLYEMNKLDELGLLGTPGFETVEPVFDYLRQVDWASFLLSPDTIRVFSAKVINDMYFLRDLGIVDLTPQYQEAFLQTFPDEEDDSLNHSEFEAKVYGLTHVILSDSRYYQHMVDPEPFQWIFDWFDRNFERVIRENKPDVLAELAVCYLITGQPDHPMVDRVKQALLWAFNSSAKMIPSAACRTDIRTGEHRNVMTLIVFNWPEQLHPGPYHGLSGISTLLAPVIVLYLGPNFVTQRLKTVPLDCWLDLRGYKYKNILVWVW